MVEVPHAERHTLHSIDRVVDGFGRPVGDVGPVSGDDLVTPAGDRAAEPADLEGHGTVGEVAHDLVDPLGGELRVGVVIDLTHDLLRVPREPHLASWVTGALQSHQLVVLVIGEPFAGHHQPTAGTVELIVLAAAMTEGLVPHPTPALVKRNVVELDDVELIGNLDGIGQHRVEHRPIRRRQIQGRPLDPGPPLVGLCGEPAARFAAVPTFDDVEELAAADVDDLG